jgi:hypothetical protein
MKRQPLAVIADAAFLIAGLFVLYTVFGGAVRWKTALFRITLTEPTRPLQICLLALVIKMLFGLERGLFASLSTRRLPAVSPLAARLHQLDRYLHALFVAHWANLVLVVAVVMGSLGLFELYSRQFPQTLPQALGNHLATGYHTGPSGIYRYSSELRMNLMRPSYERRMYFNGYTWHHKTDSLGFRNPVERATASVVLLGDSMVYGHGLEETSTVRHHLEALLGQPVANLGIQGNAIHQEYQVLKTYGLRLRPRYVFLFFLANDVDDLGAALTDSELIAFLKTSVTDHTTPYFEIDRRPARPFDLEAYLAELYVVKAFDFLWQSLRAHGLRRAEAAEAHWRTLPPFQDRSRMALAMEFHLHALRKIQDLADRHRFALVNVFTYTGTGVFPQEPIYEGLLESFCHTHGIAFLSLRSPVEQAIESGQDVFLKRDGHFSDRGARLAAEVLARYVDDHPPPARP